MTALPRPRPRLAGESGYQDAAPERGVLVTGTPFPLRIDVAALLDRA